MPTPSKSPLAAVHARLRTIMQRYERGALKARSGRTDAYTLIGPPTGRSWGREVWFGGVRTGKSCVSYHLMAVYAFPDLLDGLSPGLKRLMQGKSCFNFKEVDKKLFDELAGLTERSYRRFRKEKLIKE